MQHFEMSRLESDIVNIASNLVISSTEIGGVVLWTCCENYMNTADGSQ